LFFSLFNLYVILILNPTFFFHSSPNDVFWFDITI
jgi:hypothetical protein